ncbi:MAG: PH domain-containing protein [Nitrospinota bacterium]|nr:PH domain-containing protein [Nitrospinota bacterium]
MPEDTIEVHSSWAHFTKDFIFSLSLIALGLVVLFVGSAKTALYYSVVRLFSFLELKLDVEKIYNVDLNSYISDTVALYVPIGLFILALFVNFSILYRKRFTWLLLGEETVMKKYGLMFWKSREIKYSSIRTVENWQGGLQKILKIGDVMIAAGGSQGYDIEMEGVSDPDEVADMIRNRQKATRPGKLSGIQEKYDYY